jgi:elongation factor P--(R)-beta-lysine ligase
MTTWRPDRFLKQRKNLETRAKILAAMRGYFAAQDFIEVDTPALQVAPGADPHIHAFKTEYDLPHGGARPLYLHTSPEFACKKLLAAGFERIYQLAHVFRNKEGSSRHHPEFMLLEWYRAGAGYEELMEDCMALLRASLKLAGKNKFSYGGMACAADTFDVLSVAEAFKCIAGMDILATVDNPQNPSVTKLAEQAKNLGIRVAADDRWEDVALRIIGEKIEPHLGKIKPCFLTDYPLCMAALARAKPGDGRVAERFELYVCGMELANAFVELTDATIQRERLMADSALKKSLYGSELPLDEEFLAALGNMPEAAGIALGVDRLVMLATGTEDIRDVLWLPVAGAEK